ncbi:MAG TPA: PDZ domain-containing protein [Rhodanobacteraceae bacterium]|nr:PDZ domain-containing protein [Rhodanobacteraceae bacterium]
MATKNRIQLRPTAFAITIAMLAVAAGAAHAAGEEQALTGVSAAAVHSSAGAGLTVEQRLREELSVVMMDLIQSGAFGNTAPQQITLDVDAPAQKVSNLGLLVDSKASAGDGLHVLAVTPGGNAERIGIRAGDVLVALNGNALTASESAATLRQTVDSLPDGGRLDFNVRRDGRTERMGGSSASMYLPAMHLSIGAGTALAANTGGNAAAQQGGSYSNRPSNDFSQGCGRINDFDVAPRGQRLHAAKIIAIDNVTPGPHGSQAYRVTVGPHTVKVAERIESRYLAFNDRQRNAQIQGGYKTITIDVAPNTTYLVGARLNEDQRDNPKDGAYWDPVMYREAPEECR